MKGKFAVYALVVTLLSTTFSWGRMLSSASNGSPNNSSSGSSWNTHTPAVGGAWGGGTAGGGHK